MAYLLAWVSRSYLGSTVFCVFSTQQISLLSQNFLISSAKPLHECKKQIEKRLEHLLITGYPSGALSELPSRVQKLIPPLAPILPVAAQRHSSKLTGFFLG
ncbi:hypothetical protein VTO42DRAFT_2951 [Malbranchea cinnamomea]